MLQHIVRNGISQNVVKIFNKHENRTLALFKLKYQGQNSVSLAPKSYFCSGEDGNKSGSRGVQIKQNNPHL